MRLRITGVGSQLQGVGRDEAGRAVFVPGALPDELVEATVVRTKDRFAEARLDRVLEANPDRREPDCPYADVCGGCAARHMAYPLALRLKRQRVLDALTRVGGLTEPTVLDTLGMDDPTRMRNKAEYAIGGGKIGCLAAGSHRIIEVDDCLLQRASSLRALRETRAWLRAHPNPGLAHLVTRETRGGDLMVILAGNAPICGADALRDALLAIPGFRSLYACRLHPRAHHATDGDFTLLWGERTLTETLCGLRFRLSPASFFQTNPAQAEALLNAVADAAAPDNAVVLDAYCGAGAIALRLAGAAKRAIGFEIVPEAVADAKINAEKSGLRATFLQGDAASVLPKLLAEGVRPDVLTLDPPRAGIDARMIRDITAARIPRVVYVSCDPGTLARDLKGLCAPGGYALAYALPIDMFPWTAHVETLCLLHKTKA